MTPLRNFISMLLVFMDISKLEFAKQIDYNEHYVRGVLNGSLKISDRVIKRCNKFFGFNIKKELSNFTETKLAKHLEGLDWKNQK